MGPKIEGLQENWTLMGSHGVVLFYIAANPNATMREMSESLLLTERRITGIVRDLAAAGMVEVFKIGRRNSYRVNGDAFFRHPTLSHVKLQTFVDALGAGSEETERVSVAR